MNTENVVREIRVCQQRLKDLYGILMDANSQFLTEMQELLVNNGYRSEDAFQLISEGMGPEELRQRLKEKDGLERTHRIFKVSTV